MKCEIVDDKKGKLWDRLLKRAEVEKAEEERKFQEDCKRIGLQ